MTTLTIQPSDADAFILDNFPSVNTGSAAQVQAGVVSSGKIRRSVFRFDFSALPADITIISATLSLYHAADSDAPQEGETYWIYRLTQTGWVESQVTWDDYATSTPWTSAGGDFTTTDGSSAAMAAIGNWTDWDVKTLVEYFIDNDSSIANFLLVDDTEVVPDGLVTIHSNNYVADTSLRPKLVIEYIDGILNTSSLNQQYVLDAPTLYQEVLNQRYSLTGAVLITTFLNQRYALSGTTLNLTSLNQLYALVVPTGPFSLFLNQRYILNGFHIPATVYHAVTYTLTLTGAPDSLDDIILPMSSFQTRLKDGNPSWLSVISPNSRDNADSINARPNGELVVTRIGIKEDGTSESIERARVTLETIRTDEGSFKSSATLAGHKTTSVGTPKGVALELASLISVYSGKIHIESKMDSSIVPGDQAEHDSQVFTVGEVFIAVNPRFTKMRITEA